MRKRAIISVNISVLLFGLAGLFAKWIQLPAISITFGRVLFSSIALSIFILVKKQSFQIRDKRDGMLLIAAGIILALHWWTFLKAIQLSTVAIGTITFSTFPLFVTILEPLVYHRRLKPRNILIACLILLGVIVTIPEFSIENHLFLGVLAGMVSALSYAVLTLMNKGFRDKYSGSLAAFYEQAAATVVLFPFVLHAGVLPTPTDLTLLIILGVITTAVAHTLFISSLKVLPAQLAGICSAMETVYGILFALLLLGEVPSVREVIGAVIIVGVVILAQKYRE